jgi:hypothetical protein
MTELAEAVASLVGPYLPMLLARGETLLEEAEIALAPDLRKRANAVWERLHPSLSASPTADSAARLAAESPDDARARAEFEIQLADVLRGDETLAEEIREILERDSGEHAASIATAVEGVRAASDEAGLDERVARVLEADLAIVLDEANRPQANAVVFESRLRAMKHLVNEAVIDATARERLEEAMARLGRVLGVGPV